MFHFIFEFGLCKLISWKNVDDIIFGRKRVAKHVEIRCFIVVGPECSSRHLYITPCSWGRQPRDVFVISCSWLQHVQGNL